MKIKLIILILSLFLVTGCGNENKINSDSPLVNAKNDMIEKLDNFSYDINITVKTGVIDMTSSIECKEDIKNEITYCYSDTYGVQEENYIDYKNKIHYSRNYLLYSKDPSNGKWTKKNFEISSSWLNLNDYIFNISEEVKDNGIYYTGTISSKKLASVMALTDKDIDISKVVSDEIDICVLVNNSGYIEKMTFDMKILGLDENIEVDYKNYNSSDVVTIPNEVKDI